MTKASKMTTSEAYELTLDKINELEEAGVEVEINPYPSQYAPPCGEGCPLPREKWVCVNFVLRDESERLKVREAANYLGMCGISFDSGGMENQRDWQLDWSFNYTGEDNIDWREMGDDVEDLIQDT